MAKEKSKENSKSTIVAATKAAEPTKIPEPEVSADTFISMKALNFADKARVKYIAFTKHIETATVKKWEKLLQES